MQYSLIDIECMYLLNPCVVEEGETSHDVTHISGYVHCNTLSVFGLWKLSCIIISWNASVSVLFTSNNGPLTLIRRVILWHNELTPGVLSSRCKMIPTHHEIPSHRYWIFLVDKQLSEQKRKTPHKISGWIHHIQYDKCIRVTTKKLYYDIMR